MKKLIPLFLLLLSAYGCGSSSYVNSSYKSSSPAGNLTIAILPIQHELNFDPDSAYYFAFKRNNKTLNTFEIRPGLNANQDNISLWKTVLDANYTDDELESKITLDKKIGKDSFEKLKSFFPGADILLVPGTLSIEQTPAPTILVVGKVVNTCYDLKSGDIIFYYNDNVNLELNGTLRSGGLVTALGMTVPLHKDFSEQGRYCSKLLAANCKIKFDEVLK
ncbi:MAG: hypothetical protein HF312_17470 [Ignavibacteria bacterium]|jgi:hypothetical protein|nr:hypothetical protein [Ignavibacteria bacterium]MCU7522008.1 hypothetical protein [Ignavibacteria bacterium]